MTSVKMLSPIYGPERAVAHMEQLLASGLAEGFVMIVKVSTPNDRVFETHIIRHFVDQDEAIDLVSAGLDVLEKEEGYDD